MQEELGELECSESNGVLVWLCPLCQQGQTDRDALALHLTHKHNVLPACLDKLLETAVPVDFTSEDNMEDKAQNNIDSLGPQQMHFHISEAPSDPSEADLNTEGPNQDAGSWVKLASSPEKEIGGEGARELKEDEGSLEPSQERTELPDDETMKSEKGSTNAAVDQDGSILKSNATVSDYSSREKFLDPNRPFKCHTCLESFASKSALSLHYSSPTHLQRIRTVWAKQGGVNETSIQPNPIRPFKSSKPYQCAVCRVSYNHAITLESHLKSVLHQTRSRNSAVYQTRVRKYASNAAGNSESKGAENSVMATSSEISSGGGTAQVTSVTTGNCSDPGSLAVPAMTTKDEEQMKPHPVLSLLSSPVASAQAVSAFLTLLTSSSPSLSPSLLPSLFTVNASASPATPAAQLIPQQQLLLPLFLNGLQGQNQSPNPESSNPILTQPVSVLGLNATQQALLAQRLSCLQSLGLAVGNSAQIAQTSAEEKETRDTREEEEMVEEQQHNLLCSVKTDEEKNKCGSLSEAYEHKEQAGSNLSVEEEVEGKNTSEKYYGEIIQPNLNSPTTSTKVADDSFSPGNASLPSNTSLSPIHLNLTLSPDTTPQKSHTDASLSPSSNPSPNHSSKPSPNCATMEHKSYLVKPSHLNNIPALDLQDPACTNANVKLPNPKPGPPILSEFQHQVLWAFLESRSEADAASPSQEDCEALSLELGLEVEEVRRWLWDAWEARDRGKLGTEHASCKVVPKDPNVESDERATDEEPDEGEGVLTIVESEVADSPATHSCAMDLSSRGKEQESENHVGDLDKEEFYTSVIVTDEESQESSMREEPVSPMRIDRQELIVQKKENCGGKVLRSSTVFLSDAEDEDDDEEGGTQKMKRKRKQETENEEADIKRERLDVDDVDLELEAQTDPPAPLSVSVEQQSLPGIGGSTILHSLPLSLSLAPFATQFLSPYVLQLPASAVRMGMNAGEENRRKAPSFTNPPAITRYSGPFSDPLNAPPPASHIPPSRFQPNGGEFESALDLSIGKNHSSTTSSSSSSSTSIKEAIAQRDRLLDELGFKPTAVSVPGAGGLLVVRVKPEHAVAIPPSTDSNTVNMSSNNKAKTNSAYIRTAEQVSKPVMDRGREKDQEREKDSKSPKAHRYRDMRRSRTIIHTEQLDVLYGCYFKDPNPGKHEFEQIAEWVNLPKKVVQIWFQNMRARERKGEVRFISDGTLAAVGKPLIKFTWPLTLPIFSSHPKPNPSAIGSSGVTKVSTTTSPTLTHPKMKLEMEQLKEKEKVAPFVPKLETPTPAAKPKLLPKVKAVTAVPEVAIETQPCLPYSSLKSKGDTEEEKRQQEEEITDEEEGDHVMEKIGPGATNRMIPKQSTSTSKSTALGSQKHNGLNYWSPKGPFKINTLTREQLGLSTARNPVVSVPAPAPTPTATTSTPPPTTVKSSHVEAAFIHHSTPRRPRTHLSSLQLSILQSCYETCAHPNALECETLGTELGLPLKVVQIWFQNTRAKEKRWRLQQEKQFPGAIDSKKVEFRAGSYLQYSALRANRPILPKPVHLTEVEPATPSVQGQPVGQETLRGRCEVCGVAFESRTAGRAHVFSSRHLATLRATNFGQPPSLVNSSPVSGSGSGGVAAPSLSSSPAISTS